MAQREKQGVKRPALRTGSAQSAAIPPAGTKPTAKTTTAEPARAKVTQITDRAPAADTTRQLEQERDELRAALEAANLRISALEQSQGQVANRIGWVIDALLTLKNDTR